MTEKDVAGPVEETIRLGRSMGINSTPTLVLPDGRVMPGYREAAELRKLINETSSK
jgi:thiol:disulfide interchange protein DsbC